MEGGAGAESAYVCTAEIPNVVSISFNSSDNCKSMLECSRNDYLPDLVYATS